MTALPVATSVAAWSYPVAGPYTDGQTGKAGGAGECPTSDWEIAKGNASRTWGPEAGNAAPC